MTYTVHAFTNDRARLLAGKCVTTDQEVAMFAAKRFREQGYVVTVANEEGWS